MNVIMESVDRNLFGVLIKQKTDRCFLSVSDLTDAYTIARIQKGWSHTGVDNITRNKSFVERVYYTVDWQKLENDYKIIKPQFSGFIEECQKENITKVLKRYKLWQTTGARETRQTWCDPYIWVLLALELNPEIYGTVVKWLTDKLIFNRIEAGINYKPLTDAVNEKFNDVQFYHYINIAKAINKKIFGEHYPNIRNNANEKQLSQLNALEVFLHNLLEADVITNYQETVNWIDKFKLPQ
jgi:hypothetical protein